MTDKTSLSVEAETLEKFRQEKIFFYRIAQKADVSTDEFLLYLLDMFRRHRRSNKK